MREIEASLIGGTHLAPNSAAVGAPADDRNWSRVIPSYYIGCNVSASPDLHGAAFFPRGICAIRPRMGSKYPSYIKQWRKFRDLTQDQLLGRLIEIAGDPQPNDETLAIPLTGASLSRIENGHQNFTMATLAAIAKALDVEEPGWLLDRNPYKGGEVVSIFDKLSDEQAQRATAVIKAMFSNVG